MSLGNGVLQVLYVVIGAGGPLQAHHSCQREIWIALSTLKETTLAFITHSRLTQKAFNCGAFPACSEILYRQI